VTHSWWWLIVDALALYRLTRLIVSDSITDPIRKRLLDHAKRLAFQNATANQNRPTPYDSNVYGKFWNLITCPWCLSIWFAIPVIALTKLVPGVWQYPALGLTLSAVAGLISHFV
jgi:hypothetical protein